MSNYKIIAQVSSKLHELLWSAFQLDYEIDVPNSQAIVFDSPAVAAKNSASRLSLWLYDITQNEFVSSQPMMRMGATERQAPPLGVNLHYMVTPFMATELDNQLLLAKIIQVFHDNSLLLLEGEGITEELRILQNQESLQDMSRIWNALREPYRLSICYQVKTVRIDSSQTLASAPIQGR